ncbi:TRAP transporter large permease [Castellaniella sp. GW247-6E4]|uniref:TRAP transporter large permease n=1 Tax=Castellaniella sp. GW247-6E4 TaxID=3140380 RepID=UPI003315D534
MESFDLLRNISIILGILLPLLFIGMHIGIAMACVGIFALVVLADSGGSLIMLGLLLFNTLADQYALISLPLFVFMGYLILHIGLAEKIFNGSKALVSSVPGGLLHANIFSSAIFSAMCGSSVATAASLGSVAISLEIDEHKYPPRSVMGSLAAGGTLGILIPPSVTFIAYGVFVGESIGQLFAAGIIPGILLALIFMVWIYLRAVIQPSSSGPKLPFSFVEAMRGLYGMWSALALIIAIIASMYTGLATPTEAAALGCVFAALIGVFGGRLSWATIRNAAQDAVYTTCFLILLIVTAQIVSLALSMLEVPQQITAWVTSMDFSIPLLFTVLVVMYICLGMFLEPASMLFLTLPIVHPLMVSLGFSPVWLGVVLVVLVELSNLTPPVGFNLFVIQGVSGGRPMKDVVIGTIPYWMLLILMLALLYLFPQIALWLPGKLF